MNDGFSAVYEMMQRFYPCLDITCADVGGYLSSVTDGVPTYVAGAEPCVDAAPTSVVGPNNGAGAGVVAGYAFSTDVSEHAQIDLDQDEFDTLLAAFDFAAAKDIYENGKFSMKTSGLRTLQGFSTEAGTKLAGEDLYELYRAYWGADDYADQFVTAALDGTGPYVDSSDLVRDEIASKGAAYQNTWMYVIHELEDAVLDCQAGTPMNNEDPAVHAWDEGWAFYAGSLEDGTGSGVQVYALAETRCANFFTCTGDDDGDASTGRSAVNAELLSLYQEGQLALNAGNCNGAALVVREIVKQMTVPLIQGVLRYAYLADQSIGGVQATPEEWEDDQAEGWAFTAAVMPQLDACDADVAEQIRANMEFVQGNTSPVQDGYEVVYGMLQDLYPCLGITCADVGGYLSS
ncbi:MAG: hypothetical protein AAFY46_12230, partial [Planctomycetota bacterium]